MRRDLTVLEDQDGLEQPRRAGRRLRVPDVGLDGAHRERRRGVAPLPEHGAEGAHLDRIAERGAGAVGLHVNNVFRVRASVGQRRPEERLLGGAARDREAAARAVVVGRRAAEARQDRIAIGEGVREALQHDDAAALGAHVPVRLGVEGPAPPARRLRSDPGRGDGDLRRQHEVHAAGDGEVAAARAQALAGEVERHQRGRARRAQAMLGPRSPSRYDRRPALKLGSLPSA